MYEHDYGCWCDECDTRNQPPARARERFCNDCPKGVCLLPPAKVDACPYHYYKGEKHEMVR